MGEMSKKINKWEIEKENLQGIKIRNFNFTMIIVTCIIYIFLLFLTMNTYRNYKNLETSTQNYITCENAAEQLRSGSDYLTEQVRYFAETGNMEYVQAYFKEANETKRRDNALQELMGVGAEAKFGEQLSVALSWSRELMKTECYSMRLTAEAYSINIADLPKEVQQVELTAADAVLSDEQMEAKGRMLVFDDAYQKHKNSIYENLDELAENVLSKTQSQITENSQALSKSLSEQRTMITVLFVLTLIMFSFIILLVIRPLKIYIYNIQNDTLFDVVGSYEFKYLALTYNNIYEINAENKESLRYNAEHDKLTGVLNRTAFESLTRYLERMEIPMALLIVDVDKFKTVNDTYGHEVGDEVLKKVSKLLQNGTRASDKIVRYGGDEFVIIMSDITPANEDVIRRKIEDFNDALLHPTDGLPAVSISVGVAFAEKGYDEEVFKKADEALYRIKNGGRNGCGFADDGRVES